MDNRKLAKEYAENFFKIIDIEKKFGKADKEERKKLFRDYVDILKLINDSFLDNDLTQNSATQTILAHMSTMQEAVEMLAINQEKREIVKNASYH